MSLRHATGNSGMTVCRGFLDCANAEQAREITHASQLSRGAFQASSPCSRGRALCPNAAAPSRGAWRNELTTLWRMRMVTNTPSQDDSTYVDLTLECSSKITVESRVRLETLPLFRRELDWTWHQRSGDVIDDATYISQQHLGRAREAARMCCWRTERRARSCLGRS